MSKIGEKKSTGASDGTKFSGAKNRLLIILYLFLLSTADVVLWEK